MNWMKSFSIDQLQWGYIVFVIILAALIFAIARHRKVIDTERVTYLMNWFEHRGIGVVYQFLVIIGVFCLAWIGWRVPAEIDNFTLGLKPNLDAFPRADTMVGRLGQCIGAISLAFIALRSMRFIVPIIAGMIVVVIILLSYHYIGYRI